MIFKFFEKLRKEDETKAQDSVYEGKVHGNQEEREGWVLTA